MLEQDNRRGSVVSVLVPVAVPLRDKKRELLGNPKLCYPRRLRSVDRVHLR